MKILLQLIALIIMGAFLYLKTEYNTPWMDAIAFGGFIAGVFWMLGYMIELKKRLKAYKRQLDKTEVTSESSSSKVSVLEAKIEVLEKALKNALENNK